MSVDALTVERWVGEGLIKCAHIVLSSRIYRCSRTLPSRSKSNWFKLEVEEVDDAAHELAKYRSDVTLPVVIQIFLQPGGPNAEPGPEELLEEWEMLFAGVAPSQQPRGAAAPDAPAQIYKRMCVMARTLYSYARVLPAYGLYRTCCEQRAAHFNMTYRIASARNSAAGAAAVPWAGPRLERFAFAPIDTTTGSLRVAVQYAAGAGAALRAPARPVSIPQHVITNYVRPDMRGQAAPQQPQVLSASAAPILTQARTAGGAVLNASGRGFGMLARAVQRRVSGGRSTMHEMRTLTAGPDDLPAIVHPARPIPAPLRPLSGLPPDHPASAPCDWRPMRNSPVPFASYGSGRAPRSGRAVPRTPHAPSSSGGGPVTSGSGGSTGPLTAAGYESAGSARLFDIESPSPSPRPQFEGGPLRPDASVDRLGRRSSVASNTAASPAAARPSAGLAASTSALPSAPTPGPDAGSEGAIKDLLLALEAPMEWPEGQCRAQGEASTAAELQEQALRLARKWDVDIGGGTVQRVTA